MAANFSEQGMGITIAATDRVLLSIRHLLEQEYETKEIDFYLPPLRALWVASETGEHTELEGETPEGRCFWIEKTIVSGRPDREAGEHPVGHALWSPQRSKSGATSTPICAGSRKAM
jgi:hypothetical protein